MLNSMTHNSEQKILMKIYDRFLWRDIANKHSVQYINAICVSKSYFNKYNDLKLFYWFTPPSMIKFLELSRRFFFTIKVVGLMCTRYLIDT